MPILEPVILHRRPPLARRLRINRGCEAYCCTRKVTKETAMLDLSREAIEGVPIDARELTPRQLPMQSEG